MIFLITGGCGFLGSNLSAEVVRRGEKLIIFDNLSRISSSNNLQWLKTHGDFEFIHGDIRSTVDVERVICQNKPDVVFHLAGQVAMTTSINNPRLDFEINTLGTFNLLDSVRQYSPNSIIVYSSTNKVYGDLEWVKYDEAETRYIAPDFPNGFPETIPLEFHSPYGCSKGGADQYMLDFHRLYGLKTVVFRHSSMYGARQFASFDQGWIGWFCQKAMETKRGALKEPFTISGTGKQVRDVLYADDMVELYFKAIENIDRVKGEAFNIGGGIENSLSLIELFNLLEELLDCRSKYKKNDWRQSDQKVFVSDISKAKRLINWEPKTNHKDGILHMMKWLQQF